MIDAARFVDQAPAAGFDFYAGVPCSFLTPLINRVIGDRSLSYNGATSEGEAIGQPDRKDEPQHALMGRITHELLTVIAVAQGPFPREDAEIGPALTEARAAMSAERLPFALIMEQGAVADEPLHTRPVVSAHTGRCVDPTESGGKPSRRRRPRTLPR